MEVTAIRFKRSVSSFLSECASIKTKIENDELGRQDLNKIIEEYNRCLNQQTSQAFVSSGDPTLAALTTLNKRLTADPAAPSDAVDILKDIYGKVKDGKAVPNYLTEGLKNALSGRTDYQEELEALLKLLKK